jgi:hypothetical protein
MRRFILTALLLGAPVAVQAQSAPATFDLNPYIGGISPDKPWRARGSAPLYGFDLGIGLIPSWRLEFDLNQATLSDRSDPGHSSLYGGALSVSYLLNPAGRLAPFVAFGAGLTRYVPPSGIGVQERSEFMAQPGIGALLRLWRSADARRSLALRPQVSLRWTHGWAHAPGNPVDPLYVIGLTYTQTPRD